MNSLLAFAVMPCRRRVSFTGSAPGRSETTIRHTLMRFCNTCCRSRSAGCLRTWENVENGNDSSPLVTTKEKKGETLDRGDAKSGSGWDKLSGPKLHGAVFHVEKCRARCWDIPSSRRSVRLPASSAGASRRSRRRRTLPGSVSPLEYHESEPTWHRISASDY